MFLQVCVCTYILHACQAMCVFMQSGTIDLCLNSLSAVCLLSSNTAILIWAEIHTV